MQSSVSSLSTCLRRLGASPQPGAAESQDYWIITRHHTLVDGEVKRAKGTWGKCKWLEKRVGTEETLGESVSGGFRITKEK